MIVSHKHRFIFLKTRKTAGTSVEVALSRHCGPLDIITPLAPDDEEKRRLAGGRAPQHYLLPPWRYRLWDWALLVFRRRRKQFRNHSPASFVREELGEAVWNSYFKFTIERNPYDQAISSYYWHTQHGSLRPTLNKFLETVEPKRLSNWDIYALGETVCVDRVLRYENLANEFRDVLKYLEIPDTELPRSKSGFRPKGAHYSEIMDLAARRRVEELCSREIRAFGHQWEPVHSGAARD